MKHRKISWLLLLSIMLALAILVAACDSTEEAEPVQPAATEKPAEEPTEEPVEEPAESDRCGDRSKLSEQLNFFNWGDYIDEEILVQFEEECGVEVVMDLYSSNEELIAKIQVGNSGYDLVIPTDYACGISIRDHMSQHLGVAIREVNLLWGDKKTAQGAKGMTNIRPTC